MDAKHASPPTDVLTLVFIYGFSKAAVVLAKLFGNSLPSAGAVSASGAGPDAETCSRRSEAVSGRVDGGDGEPICGELAHFRFYISVDTSIVMHCNLIRRGDDTIAVRV